jgi:hypothetical protein
MEKRHCENCERPTMHHTKDFLGNSNGVKCLVCGLKHRVELVNCMICGDSTKHLHTTEDTLRYATR